MKKIFLLQFLALLPLMAACGLANLQATQAVYVPPTLAVSPPQLETPAPTAPPATATPACLPNLTYLQDLSIPDGTVAFAGDELDKRWLVENSGTCNWDASFTLRLITGPEMGAEAVQALFPARSGSQATIRIVYTAPREAGIYRSAWQAYDSQGEPFGDPIFIEIVVQ